MDYEEKYKEAFERAKIWQKHLYEVGDKDYGDELNYIFPELKESEDERIKKRIIHALHGDVLDMEETNKAIAWLEKQGNQREQLINKACDILVNCIEDYMLRRMEVWSEECKNQTLENIRKKLEE